MIEFLFWLAVIGGGAILFAGVLIWCGQKIISSIFMATNETDRQRRD